jgi:hypothetical protein
VLSISKLVGEAIIRSYTGRFGNIFVCVIFYEEDTDRWIIIEADKRKPETADR